MTHLAQQLSMEFSAQQASILTIRPPMLEMSVNKLLQTPPYPKGGMSKQNLILYAAKADILVICKLQTVRKLT